MYGILLRKTAELFGPTPMKGLLEPSGILHPQ